MWEVQDRGASRFKESHYKPYVPILLLRHIFLQVFPTFRKYFPLVEKSQNPVIFPSNFISSPVQMLPLPRSILGQLRRSSCLFLYHFIINCLTSAYVILPMLLYLPPLQKLMKISWDLGLFSFSIASQKDSLVSTQLTLLTISVMLKRDIIRIPHY